MTWKKYCLPCPNQSNSQQRYFDVSLILNHSHMNILTHDLLGNIAKWSGQTCICVYHSPCVLISSPLPQSHGLTGQNKSLPMSFKPRLSVIFISFVTSCHGLQEEEEPQTAHPMSDVLYMGISYRHRRALPDVNLLPNQSILVELVFSDKPKI